MKITLKKRICCFIVSLAIMLSFSSFAASANEESVVIDILNYTAAYCETTKANELAKAGDGNTMFQIGDWAEYTVTIPKAGKYSVSLYEVNNGVHKPVYSIAIDGSQKLMEKEGVASSSYVSFALGEISFAKSGEFTLRISKSSGYWAYLKTITLEYVGEAEADMLINAADYTSAYYAAEETATLPMSGAYPIINNGDWAEYTFDVSKAGKYSVYLTEANNGQNVPVYSVSVDGKPKLSNKEGIASGENVSFILGDVSFTKDGSHTLRLNKVSGYWGIVQSITLKYIGEAEENFDVRIPMNSYTESYNNYKESAALDEESGFVAWRGPNADKGSTVGDWAKYTVEISEAGKYRFGIKLGGAVGYTTGIRVTINGEEKLYNNAVSILSEYNSPTDTDMGIITFNEAGSYEFLLENTMVGGGNYTSEWYLTYLGDQITVKSVMLNDTELKADSTAFSAGTDLIVINFSKNVNAADFEQDSAKVVLSDSKGNKLGFTASVNKASAKLSLTETLKAGDVYTLQIGKVSDAVMFSTLDAVTYTFSAEEGEGSASITEQTAEFKNDVATVTAKMLSSENVGIKGRNFFVYLRTPKGAVSSLPVASGLTEEGGAISFTYTLQSESDDGEYAFIINGDYVEKAAEAKGVYISKTLRDKILTNLNGCQTKEDVQSVIEANATYLKIDTENSLKGLDALKVYARFLEKKTAKFEDIKDEFNKYIAVEKISGANASTISAVLEDEENWSFLGVDTALVKALDSASTQKVKTELLAIDKTLTAEKFIEKAEAILSENLKLQFKKTDLTLAASDMSVYVGQGFEIPVAFEEEASEIKTVNLTLKLNNEEMAEDLYVTLNEKGTAKTELDDDTLSIEIVLDGTASGDDIGTVMLTAPKKTGNYDVEISGSVYYLPKDASFELKAQINSMNVSVNVKQQPGSSSGTRGSSSASVSLKADKNTVLPNGTGENVNAEYKFNDVPAAHWAFTAVDYLLKSGAIDKNEEKTFNPDEYETRGNIIKTLILALKLTDEEAECSFLDVEKTDANYKYIATAEKIGLVLGNDEGNFMKDSLIKREDFCVILCRLIDKKSKRCGKQTFDDDQTISDYAKEAVYTMRSLKMIDGVGENKFLPKGNVTKAQAAKMIYQIVKAVEK